MEIPKDIKDEIWEYCRLNDITDLNAFMVKALRQGFNVTKYGATPFNVSQKEPEVIEKEVIKEVPIEVIKEVEKIVEKEVIKEVTVEVPIEVIVEKEVIKEVPVEVEKIVEKEIYVSDDETINNLQTELESIKKDSKVHLSSLRDKVELIKEKDEKIQTDNRKITDLTNKISQLKDEINELGGKTSKLEEELDEEKKKVEELSNSDQGLIKSLNQQIENLKIELELEKNRNYERPKKERAKEDKQRRGGLGNIISWVSKNERDEDDLYNE